MDNIIYYHNKNVNIQILTYNIGNDLLMIYKFMYWPENLVELK